MKSASAFKKFKPNQNDSNIITRYICKDYTEGDIKNYHRHKDFMVQIGCGGPQETGIL